MNLLTFFRYVNGFLVIRVYSGFPERFINLCAKRNINLWDLIYEADGITLKLYMKDFIKLREIKKKSGVQIEIKEKHALKYQFMKHKERRFIFIGIIFLTVLMFFLNMFIWNIEIIGVSDISKEEILKISENVGLKTGTFVPTFDENEACRKMVNLFDGKILWMSANVKGSKAIIEIRENIERKANKDTDDSPCNFIADFDGILHSTQTFRGEQKANAGSAVSKGTILISGIYENEDGSVNYVSSEGIFVAETQKSVSQKYTATEAVIKLEEKKTYRYLKFFGMTIPLNITSFLQKTPFFSYEGNIMFNDCTLPLGFKKKIHFETSEVNKSMTLLNYLDKFTCNEYNDMKNSKILDTNYKIKFKDSVYNIHANYTLLDFIGEKSPIKTEN